MYIVFYVHIKQFGVFIFFLMHLKIHHVMEF